MSQPMTATIGEMVAKAGGIDPRSGIVIKTKPATQNPLETGDKKIEGEPALKNNNRKEHTMSNENTTAAPATEKTNGRKPKAAAPSSPKEPGFEEFLAGKIMGFMGKVEQAAEEATKALEQGKADSRAMREDIAKVTERLEREAITVVKRNARNQARRVYGRAIGAVAGAAGAGVAVAFVPGVNEIGAVEKTVVVVGAGGAGALIGDAIAVATQADEEKAK